MPKFDRITFVPGVMGGRACVRNTRVTVSLISKLAANRMSANEIVEAYPYLEPESVREALLFSSFNRVAVKVTDSGEHI